MATDRIRDEFPSAQHAVHFDHASVGPISRRAESAMSDAVAHYASHGFDNTWRNDIEIVREQVARFVRSSSGNIAFTQNTTTGLSIAANGLDWQPGDNVVVPEREFPSNFYPWLNLEPRGVQLRRVPAPAGHATIHDIAAAIDHRTRVVTISAVQYSNGHRYDLAAIGELCRQHHTLLVVDGTQSVGALAMNVTDWNIDVLAVSAHKWMLGPSGIGFAHLSDRALERIRPDIVGWLSVRDPFAFDYQLDLPATADRFEPGTENVIGIIGLGAAISLFLEHGTHEIERTILNYTDRLCDELRRTGRDILSPRTPGQNSGIVIFHQAGTDPAALHAQLAAAKIKCAPRGGGIRFSPHAYNNDDDLNAALAALSTPAP